MSENIKTIDDLLAGALSELYKASNSRKKTKYTLSESLKHKHLGSNRTKVIIDAFNFLSKAPLQKNDYSKYFIAYANNGVKLDESYFKHDLDTLHALYDKFDNDNTNHFNIQNYESYVVFMSLKLKGCYIDTDDEIFNVSTKDNREYSPITKIPTVLRGELPFKVKEYDIKRAFPTFIDIELNSEYRHTVYDKVTKKDFASALNSHSESNYSLVDARQTLSKVYDKRVDEVLTNERFNERGRAFKDFAKYEHEYINEFVKSNDLTNFVRLHDGVFVLDKVNVEKTQFDKVEFSIKECIKPTVVNDKVLFYSFDNDKVVLTPTGISDFFKQENFVRVSTGDDKIQLLKNNNNVIDYFNHKTNMVSFLESKIIEVDKSKVKDAIARHNFSTILQSYSLIKPTELKYYKDSKTRFGLPFKNGFVYFDGLGEMELKTKVYNDVDGFFSPHLIQDKTFTYTDERGDFEQFICRASSGLKVFNPANNEYKALCSIIGYLATSYKDPSNTKAIVFTDEGANAENRNGGRGKTAVTNGLSKVVKTIVKGGTEFKPDYSHNFGELKQDHRMYVIDDVPASHNYNSNYTAITGEISVQPKGKPAFNISFTDTPKFIYTTNFIFRINKNDSSTVRRFTEFKFKPYYSIKLSPKDEFGQLFFDDWDVDEWNRFYSFFYRCVFDYLKNGLKSISYSKELDNFRAVFNDTNEDLMRGILESLTEYDSPFNVTNVLAEYNSVEWYLTKDNFIHKNNAKLLVDLFIDYDKSFQRYKYNDRSKKWRVNK